MELVLGGRGGRDASGEPRAGAGVYRIGILAGAFNPPTVAHLALARSALKHVDETLFLLPRTFPHKSFVGAPLNARVEMLCALAAEEPRFSVAISEGGLFFDMARECRGHYGRGVRISFLCGRDAAERILTWDYGGRISVDEMLREFDLLVAARRGEFAPPLPTRHAIERIYLPEKFDEVSSTEVRRRMAKGLEWRHLVPEAAHQVAAACLISPAINM